MPKSLMIITGIFPPDSGGPAKFSMEFGKWVSTQDFSVSVQTYTSNDSDFVSDLGDIEIGMISRSHNILLRYLKMILEIGKKARNKSCILAVGGFLETYLSSTLFRFRYIAKVPGDIVWERARNSGLTNLNIEEFQNIKLKYRYKLFRLLFTRSLLKADVVIVPSKGILNLCLKWGIPARKIKLIYNSVDCKSLSSDKPIEKKFDLITVCRLTAWKGVDELVEYAANRGVNLVVLGEGPDRMRLESLSSKINARVVFKGEVEPRQVNEYLLQSRIFVLNSYYEGLPHALIEARVAGVLTVGRAGTGSEEVINDDIDGFLVRNNRSLGETLDLAFSIDSEYQAMTSRARIDSTLRFSEEKNFPAILSELEKLGD